MSSLAAIGLHLCHLSFLQELCALPHKKGTLALIRQNARQSGFVDSIIILIAQLADLLCCLGRLRIAGYGLKGDLCMFHRSARGKYRHAIMAPLEGPWANTGTLLERLAGICQLFPDFGPST